MFKPSPNMTSAEYVTGLHIAISHLEDGELRERFLDHLDSMQTQLQLLEDSFNLSPYEPNRRL